MTHISNENLLSSSRGGVMVMALFMALFVVAAAYYIIGIGDAIIYRRTMQDGADAGAHAASVMAAKGMNLHVLLNVVMAVTAGVLLVLRSVEVLLEIVLAVLYGLLGSVIFSAQASALIGTLSPVESTVERIGDGLEEFVATAHDALDVAHHAVQRGFPVLAQVRGVDAMAFQDAYSPPVAAGFVVPLLGPRLPDGGTGLPVEKDDLGVICDRVAGQLSSRLDRVESRAPRWLLKFLGGLVQRSLRLGKGRTCNEDVVEAPRVVIASRANGSTVWLGQEEFQYRAFDFGEDPDAGRWRRGELGVHLAQGGVAADEADDAYAIGRLGFAQSEYYFAGDEPKHEWTWKQRWRARLRRFRLPRGIVPEKILSACSASRGRRQARTLASACDVVRDFSLNAFSAH